MLKRIIKTHTTRLDFCLYYRAYFFFFTKRYRLRTAKDGWSLVIFKIMKIANNPLWYWLLTDCIKDVWGFQILGNKNQWHLFFFFLFTET